MPNNAGFTLLFPNGFLQEQHLFAQQNSQTGEPLAKLGSGPLKQSQVPAAASLGVSQWRKHSHCRKHLSGKPRCHQEYLGGALGCHPRLRHTGCSSEHTFAPHTAAAREIAFATGVC